MRSKLKVAFVSSEFSPFAKSGELADVASSLPKYLSALGLDVSVFLPKYRLPEIESLSAEVALRDLAVPLGGRTVKARVYRSELGRINVYLIDNPTYFWRENIYGTGKGEYLDNDERFIFFSRAVLETLLRMDDSVDIIHCNSWHTALIPVFLRTHYAKKELFKETATLITLHNVTYQGEFPPETLALTDLNWKYFTPKHVALNGKFNFLKSGILFSDRINTVSAAYKREIMSGGMGQGLEDILKSRKKDFTSIQNGVDYDIWNPATDPFIEANYTPGTLHLKKENKKDLIREFGLSLADEEPLLGVVSYLTKHKGLDILCESIDDLMAKGAGLVILGQGEDKYEKLLLKHQQKYPGKVVLNSSTNSVLAHKVIAGVDMYLMPSLHEPCGLNHLYALKYGTVPVVRATGGLAETVRHYTDRSSGGNGFVFKEYTSTALIKAIEKALTSFGRPKIWRAIMKTGIHENFSWEKAAKSYLRLYSEALDSKRGG